MTRAEGSYPPIALTIAGSDSGGGAGIQADLKTFSALGVYGASVITALTAQNTREVRGVFDVDPGFVRAQIEAVFDDLAVDAVKIGMLSRADIIEAVADALEAGPQIPVVLDPVMVAKSGDPLLRREAIAALRDRLLPLAAVVTPNLPEAGVLLDRPGPGAVEEMAEAARALHGLGPRAVLVKGGHLPAETVTDILWDGIREHRFASPRIETRNTHGTGCTLSSAIAAGLARGMALTNAVAAARDYLQVAIRRADDLHVGSGHGPVHHFHALWREEAGDR